jgi:prophage regulatory protein
MTTMTDRSTPLPEAPGKPHRPLISGLPAEGFVRLKDLIGPGKPLPFSKSHWWQGIAQGRYPKPVKISEGITAWEVSAIREVISNLARQNRP